MNNAENSITFGKSDDLEFITSKDNKTIKYIQSLNQKKYRQKYNSYIVEGLRNLLDTYAMGKIKKVLLKESLLSNKDINSFIEDCEKNKVNVFIVTDALFSVLENTVQGQGLIGEIEKQNKEFSQFILTEGLYLYLDNIQDPGNLGTIIRTAVATNVKAILLSKGSVDPFNDKVVRSAMSALSKIDIYANIDKEQLFTLLTEDKLQSCVTTLAGAKDYRNISYKLPLLLVMGNEGNGVRQDIIERCQDKITIPMYGDIESLNLSVATALCLYKIRELSN